MTIDPARLVQQADGVWSMRRADEIAGFKPNRLLPVLTRTHDLSSLNAELINEAENLDEELWLSHQRANVVRAFDWSDCSTVLEIGCQAGCVTRYLAEQRLHVEAIETDRSLAQLAAYRTREFAGVKVIDMPLEQIDFGGKRYDAIVLNGMTDNLRLLPTRPGGADVDTLKQLIFTCRQLLTPKGKLLISADNTQGIKYAFGAIDERTLKPYSGYQHPAPGQCPQSLNLSQWRQLLTEQDFASIEEYYLWPDYRFARVLLGREYTRENQYAFQHLEAAPSVDYFHPLDIGTSEHLLYQSLSGTGQLGTLANSLLFVLSNTAATQSGALDFAHFPDFTRHRDYLSVVIKKAAEPTVRRKYLCPSAAEPSKQRSAVDEAYIPGIQLSTIWMRSILNEPQAIQFEQYLRAYFDYLKKLDAGVYSGMNIDAIANNIVLNEKGHYQLIDREWLDVDDEIDAVFVFYRALIQFSMRNQLIYHQFKWVHGLSTLTDFLLFGFKAIGINPKLHTLEQMRVRDLKFSASVLKKTTEYELSDPFGYRIAPVKAITYLAWRYADQYDYQPAQKVIANPKAGHDAQTLTFVVPHSKRRIACIRFFPFQHLHSPVAGYLSINSIILQAVDHHARAKTLWELPSADEINRANIHRGVFFAAENDHHVFMFNNNDTFLEFELPDYQMAEEEALHFMITFRLKQSHDYEIARKKYALVEREFAEKQVLKEDELKALRKKYNKINRQLEEVQASRIWRLLVAYRDTFKISGYPEKHFPGKLKQLVRRYRRSK